MLRSFTEKWTDQSTKDQFAFVFYCDLCNKPWKSVPIPFSLTNNSLWQKLFCSSISQWKTEHKDAYERANREGMLQFNRCNQCKKWVCDEDFKEEDNKCCKCLENKKFIGGMKNGGIKQ